MSLEELQALERRYVMPTYARAPVEFVRGEGSWLWDSSGRRYLDFFAGLSVHNAGHCNPRIIAAIAEQAARLIGVSNLYYSAPGLRLCERLARSSLGGRVFLCNSGAEANEAAIKLARRNAHERGIERPRIVTLEGGFHGRTLGALAASPRLARDDRFGPPLPGFTAVGRDDPDTLGAAIDERTAAVVIEPIQGEAGVVAIDDELLIAAREACDATGALLVFDEVQCGMGRTGTLWAYEQLAVRPDALTTAKALGGGLPAAAVVIDPALGDGLGPGDHGSTFGGGPVVAAAALATLELIDEPQLLASVAELGNRLRDGLARLEGIVEVRGRGLMIGVTIGEGLDAPTVATRALEAGLVINVPGERMLRLLPPLTIAPVELDEGLERLASALR